MAAGKLASCCVRKAVLNQRVKVPSGQEPNPPVAGHCLKVRTRRAKRGVKSLFGGSKSAGSNIK